MKLLAKYKNGNYMVTILSDGTKIRETINPDATEFIPEFAENCDVKITDRCDGGCPWCYEGCTVNGKHADLLSAKWVDTLHPGTELALNGNDMSNTELLDFLIKLKNKGIIANLTVNQKHFMKFYDALKEWSDDKLIHGLGISLVEVTDDFIEKVKSIPNTVIHTINGILDADDINKLSNHDLKILILGYKNLRRGSDYLNNDENNLKIGINQTYLKNEIENIIPKFQVVSFDNLAINQLDIKRIMSDEEWDEFYMGDDGSFTFYIDMVENTFAQNSLSMRRYPIMPDMTIDDMFEIIRKEKKIIINN